MGVVFITDARFFRTPSGKIYAGEYSFSEILWKRYREFFGEVVIIGRVFNVDSFLHESHVLTSVKVLEVKAFASPLSFLKENYIVRNQISKYLDDYKDWPVIVRAANVVAYCGAYLCRKKNIPYGMEVINDPFDIFSVTSMKHPLLPVFRYIFTRFQKQATKYADAVIYVTEKYLQKRYPANEKAFVTYASDVIVNLDKNLERKEYSKDGPFKIISVGALELLYKGPDIAIKAVSILRSRGYDVNLRWLGYGKNLDKMIELSRELEVSEFVYFEGSVNYKKVIDFLDESDCFILLSRTEGLPRAIVEAMSRGLPCIGTDVGGIPELIHPNYVVASEDVDGVVEKLIVLLENEREYQKQVEHSTIVVKEFDPNILEEKRNSFFNAILKRSKV